MLRDSWVRRLKKRLLMWFQKFCSEVKSERLMHWRMYSTMRFTCKMLRKSPGKWSAYLVQGNGQSLPYSHRIYCHSCDHSQSTVHGRPVRAAQMGAVNGQAAQNTTKHGQGCSVGGIAAKGWSLGWSGQSSSNKNQQGQVKLLKRANKILTHSRSCDRRGYES